MRKIRSIAVSVATALLMTFMVSLFVPGFAFKVNAADGVISVTNEAELKSALESSASKGKTVQVSKTINLEKSISINTSLTLDLNDNKLIFSEGYFLWSIINIFTRKETSSLPARLFCRPYSLEGFRL